MFQKHPDKTKSKLQFYNKITANLFFNYNQTCDSMLLLIYGRVKKHFTPISNFLTKSKTATANFKTKISTLFAEKM